MNKFRLTTKVLAIATFMFAFASITQAQATRTWVSGVGDDANPCSRTAPCKTFAGAISKTAACGEIDALDPGGFGAVTITKSITIDGTGTLAGILASLTTGIIVNAGVNDVITIRGLSIDGACNGIRGMNILQAKEVNVEDTVIFRFANEGILVNETDAMQLNIRNCVIRDNVGDGLGAGTNSNILKASIVNSSFTGNGVGLRAKKNSRISADRCNFSANTNDGVFADGTGGVSVADITNSLISNNGTNGIQANAGGIGRIQNCDIFTNGGTGALVGAGEIDTWGNNRIFSNGTDNCPGCTPKGVS
ncbi:MAG TPA: right-handed parallel beta-helix repeat-containing protein [Pyrinomonadaceae bacterium]